MSRSGVRATMPRSFPSRVTPVTTPTGRSNSLSRGLQKMLKANRTSKTTDAAFVLFSQWLSHGPPSGAS